MRRIIFIGLAIILATPAFSKRPPVDAAAERCTVAIAYANALLVQLHDRVVFTSEGEQAYSHINARGWVTENGSPSSSPPIALLRIANRKGRVDALSSCPLMARGLKTASSARRVTAKGSTVEVSGIAERGSKVIIVGVSLPVISSDKKSAILFSSQVSGPLAAGTYAYYMRFCIKNGWIIVSSKSLGVA